MWARHANIPDRLFPVRWILQPKSGSQTRGHCAGMEPAVARGVRDG